MTPTPTEPTAESDASGETSTEAPPKRKRNWKRIGMEVGFFLLIFLGLRAWQSRDTASGPAPALAAASLAGEQVSLLPTDEPVLVHFWATWCGVCQAEEGNVVSVAEGHRVISVASQSGAPAAVAAYAREHELGFPVINDPTGAIARRWGVHAFPTSFVIDPEGRIRHVEVGYTSTLGLRGRLWLAGL